MEHTFTRDLSQLELVFALLDEFADTQALAAGVRFSITMAVEELFTNMVKYNPGGGEIRIACTGTDDAVEVRLTDTESTTFDVTQDRGVDTEATLTERTPGGLGLHLIQRMMDEIHYRFTDGVTEIRIIKNR